MVSHFFSWGASQSTWFVLHLCSIFNYYFISGNELLPSPFSLTCQSCILTCLFGLSLSLIPGFFSTSTLLAEPIGTFYFSSERLSSLTSNMASTVPSTGDMAPLLRDFAIQWKTNMILTEKLQKHAQAISRKQATYFSLVQGHILWQGTWSRHESPEIL